jgi:hypothetical protein
MPQLIFVKTYDMEQQKKQRGLYWLIFLASTAALIFAIYSHWEWLTLILPFQNYCFCKSNEYHVILFKVGKTLGPKIVDLA